MAATRMRFLGPISTHVFNPGTRLFAGRLPGFGVLTHIGRKTGRMYRTPLLVLRRGDDYLVGLWYGSDAHWVKNVLAAGACELRIRGRNVRLVQPELLVDPARRLLPLPLRLAGRLVHLTEFLRMSPTAKPTARRQRVAGPVVSGAASLVRSGAAADDWGIGSAPVGQAPASAGTQ